MDNIRLYSIVDIVNAIGYNLMNKDWEEFETVCKLSGYVTNSISKAYNTLTILNFYLTKIIKCKIKCYNNHHIHFLDYILNEECILTITHEKSRYNKNMIVKFIDKYNRYIPSSVYTSAMIIYIILNKAFYKMI